MSRFSTPHVLILAVSRENAQRWAAALAGGTVEVWLEPAEVPADRPVEVVITDFATRDDALARVDEEILQRATVLGIEAAHWGDVNLAADCLPSELRTACTLLAAIARLRAERDRVTRSRQEIRELAFTDPLTGLPNRRAWNSELDARHERGSTFALAIVDLDRFKDVNDRCGLAVGDAVLRQAAQALADSLRRDDLVARLGGDEFGVLLTAVDESQAERALERLRAAVAAQAPPEAGAGPITASIGYTLVVPHQPIAEAFAAAERGLRQAKRAGANRVCREGG